MEIDVGLDAMRLSHDEQVRLAVQAARLGFTRFWTTGGGDPFHVCALRWAATRQVVPGGIGTAIGVLPVGLHILTPAKKSTTLSTEKVNQAQR